MKRLIAICIIAALMIMICGCEVVKIMPSDEAIANAQMEAFLNALENRDTEQLISLFTANALSETENIQYSVDMLYSYYQGNYTSYNNWGGPDTSTTREGIHIGKEMHGTYDVVTDADVYRFAFLYVAVDSTVADNVGLWSVYVIKMDDDTDSQYAYRGDALYTPGIQIGIPNNLPDEEGIINLYSQTNALSLTLRLRAFVQ